MEKRGIAQVIDTRRFRIPLSQSMRLLFSFLIYNANLIVNIVNVKVLAFAEIARVSPHYRVTRLQGPVVGPM